MALGGISLSAGDISLSAGDISLSAGDISLNVRVRSALEGKTEHCDVVARSLPPRQGAMGK